MSWFTNPFTTSLRSSKAQQNDSDDDREDEPSHGKGVKEDLSELTKTFSRQLWGVASFLAPPPSPPPPPSTHHDSSSNDEAAVAPLSRYTHPKPGGHWIITEEGAVSMADEEHLFHHCEIKRPKEMELSDELVDVDFEALMGETLEDSPETPKSLHLYQIEGVTHSVSASHLLQQQSSDRLGQNVAPALAGISRDLAELKGSIANGFSRILTAPRDEVGQEESSQSHRDDTNEDEEIADDQAGSTHARKLQGINTFFRPLLGNVLPDDGGGKRVDASSDDDDDKEGHDDGSREDYTSQVSSNASAFKLHNTFIDGFKGISDFASSLISVTLNLDSREEARGRERGLQVVGITEEVLAFARNISMHPETWLDFPSFAYSNKDGEFEMSVAQKEHANAMELAIPSLAALKTELCPDCMSEGSFWKIYFVFLHSRLCKMDAVILSTPKIMEARALLLKQLQEEGVQDVETKNRELSVSKGKVALAVTSSTVTGSLESALEVQANDFGKLEDVETDVTEEVQNKSVLVDTIKLGSLKYNGDEADTGRWHHDKRLPLVHSTTLGLRNEEDVSFSDLEEDEPTSKTVERSDSQQSFGWVQLSKNQSEEDFEGLRASDKAKHRGSGHENVGIGRAMCSHASAQPSRKQDQSESSDWSTVEDDDMTSADFM